jgi:hypothetical protein
MFIVLHKRDGLILADIETIVKNAFFAASRPFNLQPPLRSALRLNRELMRIPFVKSAPNSGGRRHLIPLHPATLWEEFCDAG